MSRIFVQCIAILLCVVSCEVFCRAQLPPEQSGAVELQNRESKLFFQKLGFGESVTVDQAIESLVQLDKIPDEVVKCVTLDDNRERRRLAMHVFCRKKSAESAQVCLSALADEDPEINHLALLGIRLNYELLEDPTFAVVRILASDKRRVQSVSMDSFNQVPIACDAANLLADVGFKNHAFVRGILEECIVGKQIFGKTLNPFEQTKMRLNCSIAMVNHGESSAAKDFFLSSIKNQNSAIAEEAILSCYYLKLGANDDFLQTILQELKSIAMVSDRGGFRQDFATRVLEFLGSRSLGK